MYTCLLCMVLFICVCLLVYLFVYMCMFLGDRDV